MRDVSRAKHLLPQPACVRCADGVYTPLPYGAQMTCRKDQTYGQT